MKKLLYIPALLLILSSCSGHSDADKQQLQDARREAGEMLKQVRHDASTRPDASTPAASVAPADSVR